MQMGMMQMGRAGTPTQRLMLPRGTAARRRPGRGQCRRRSQRAAVSQERHSANQRFGDAYGVYVNESRRTNRAVLQEMLAEDPQSVGVGFSSGGFLLPYHMGVLAALRREGIVHETTRVAGTSTGTFAVSAIVGGLDDEQFKLALQLLLQRCRPYLNEGLTGVLRTQLRRTLHEVLPDDVHLRAKDRGWIGVTQVFPSIRRHLITDFSSREDYINAVLTSAHIPLYMDGALTSTFRGMPCVDGGLGNLVPKVPGCRYTVQISCIPHLNVVPGWSNIANSVPLNPVETLIKALHPAAPHELQSLYHVGERDVQRWLASTSTSFPPALVRMSDVDPDVHRLLQSAPRDSRQ